MDLCQKVEKMGVSFITVHGRTKEQRCEPVDLDAVKAVKDSVSIPVIANGDVRSMNDARHVQAVTRADGKYCVVFFCLWSSFLKENW